MAWAEVLAVLWLFAIFVEISFRILAWAYGRWKQSSVSRRLPRVADVFEDLPIPETAGWARGLWWKVGLPLFGIFIVVVSIVQVLGYF